MLIDPLIMLTILFLFLQFLLGETSRFQQLSTAAIHVENQHTDPVFLLHETNMLTSELLQGYRISYLRTLKTRPNIAISFEFSKYSYQN